MGATSHTDIRQKLIERIQSGEWPLGSRIPGETDLAQDYGCARATMNRALQGLASEGLIIRKRKGGSHVATHPVRQARITIPIIREQVETSGQAYSHELIARKVTVAPPDIQASLRLESGSEALFLKTLHKADGAAFAIERRWVNLQAVPDIMDAPLDTVSANEWLVKSVPFSSGDVIFTAHALDHALAHIFDANERDASFTVHRTTWIGERFITTMTLHYRPGYELQTIL